MFSGAGEAVSRRRWPLPTMSSSIFISMLVSRFNYFVLRSRRVLLTGERGVRRSLRWRQVLCFFVFTAVLLMALPLWWVSSPTMSREDSLTDIVLCFTGTFPGKPIPGCRRTSHSVDFVRALQLLMEFRSQPTSPRFPPLERETTNQLCVAPLHLYDTRVSNNSSLNPDLIGSSSLSSPLSVLSSSPAFSLRPNGGSAHLGRASLSPSGFDGNPIMKFLKHILSVQNMRYLAAGLSSLDNLKIFHGFIGVYNLRLLQYHFFRKNLSSSFSNEKSISPPYLPSMKGDVGFYPELLFQLIHWFITLCSGLYGVRRDNRDYFVYSHW
ncbi:Uncharacterized protein Rs2_14203 [Raphanus sativus]|nr:Uncharacterized protein Rs2_14203 [Raphanus sativus]